MIVSINFLHDEADTSVGHRAWRECLRLSCAVQDVRRVEVVFSDNPDLEFPFFCQMSLSLSGGGSLDVTQFGINEASAFDNAIGECKERLHGNLRMVAI